MIKDDKKQNKGKKEEEVSKCKCSISQYHTSSSKKGAVLYVDEVALYCSCRRCVESLWALNIKIEDKYPLLVAEENDTKGSKVGSLRLGTNARYRLPAVILPAPLSLSPPSEV